MPCWWAFRLYDRVWEAKKKKKKEWLTDAVWLCAFSVWEDISKAKNTVGRNFGIDFFVQLSVNLRNSTVTSYDFFFTQCGSKIVSFHPAKGRPVHAVFIILSASTKTCSANWYRWPYFYCCSFWCFQLSRLSEIRDSYIHGCVNFPFYIYIYII